MRTTIRSLRGIVAVSILASTLGITGAAGSHALEPTAKKKCNPTASPAKCRNADLSGRDLYEKQLVGDFRRANFRDANLEGVEFVTLIRNSREYTTKAQRANFAGAKLVYAELSGNFERANFSGARTDMLGTDGRYRGTNWSNTNVSFDSMFGDFTGANFSGSVVSADYYSDDLKGANFNGATIRTPYIGYEMLHEAWAPSATFVGATIETEGDLAGANLRGADFTNSIWVSTETYSFSWDVTGMDATGAIWVNVTCPDGSVRNAPCWQ